MNPIYFDNAATTRVLDEVVDSINVCFSDVYGNASSIHQFGRKAKELLEASRETVAKAIDVEVSEIYFTSGGSESDSLAVVGFAEANADKGNHLITSQVEHPAVLKACKYLSELRGFEVTYLPVDGYGMVNPEDLRKSIKKSTILVSIMHSNNVVGTLQPIKDLVEVAKSKGVAFHTDSVQSYGTLPISVDELGVDMLSVSSHKIHGPKGTGALFIRKGVRINSIIYGGEHEGGKRGGTENIPGIVGFAKATEISQREIIERAQQTRTIRDKLVKGVLENIDDVIYNGHPEKRLPGNASFCFRYVEGESIVLYLDMESIATSSGSACASHSLEPSHVLTAMDMKPQDALGSLRISIGRENTEQEVDYFLQVLPPIIKKLREMSPLYRNSYKL